MKEITSTRNAVEQMRELARTGGFDPEVAHEEADLLLLAMLRLLALQVGVWDEVKELIGAWNDVPKWYA